MKAIGKLLALSLISMKPDESSFSIHPLLHRWVRKDLEKDQDLLLETRKAVTYMVTSSFVFDDDATTGWSYERRVLPHIECCTELFVIQMNGYGEFMDDRDREVAYSLARAYERLSNLQKAGSLYLRALKFVNPDTASPPDLKIMDAYAVNLQTQGKLEEALTWYTQALQRAEQTIGPTSPLTLAIVQHIAKLHVEQGLYDVAVTEYKRVLEALDAKKKNHPRTLKIRYQLALVYTEQGDHATALELLQKVREAREKSPSLGPSHAATLETLESIAKIHERQEKYVEALDVQQLLLERKAASLGQNHRSTLETLDAMASVYERQGRYLEALSCHEMVLDGLSKLFGTAEHPWTFGIVARMGGVFLHLGQYADAEREYRKAYSGFRALGMEVRELEIATRVGEVLRLRCQYSEALDWSRLAETGLQEKLGRDHISTAVAKFCSARTLDLQGDYAAANKLYQQVLTDYTAHAGPQHQSVLAATAAVATSLTKQGQFAKAAQHFSTVLVQQEKLLGPNHTDTLASVQGHAILRGETGHYDQSLQLHQRVFTGLSQALGKSHPETIRASYHLATAFENKLQLTDASKYYNIAISGMPADHHYAMLAHMGMGNVHRLSERFDQAFSLYSTVLADMKQRLGNRHPDTMRCQCFLAATLVKLARFPEAEAMGAEALRGCEETLGRDHPLTLEAVHVHAKAVSKQKKRHKEARAGFARAKEGREKLLTKQHRDTMLSAREVKKVKRKSWGWFF
jgi:tetratricopeptide (TPR) repeat protein